jgi:hypothetical protein
MQTLASRCRATATIKSRVTTWTDTLVERLVCCGGRDVHFEGGEEGESDEQDAEQQEEQDDNVISGPPGDPDTVSVASDANNGQEDAVVSDPRDVTRAGALGGGVRGQQIATNMPNGSLNDLDADRALRVLQRFVKGCISTNCQRLPRASHAGGTPNDSVLRVNHNDEDRANAIRIQCSSRLRALQVHPRQLSTSPPPDVHVRSPSPSIVSPCAKANSARSPSSSVSSTDSRCSTSWRDAHPDLVAENAVLRERLETTPPRVYDYETDPRFMSQQQMRRLAILRHRDAMRAKLSEKQRQQEEEQPHTIR